MSEPSGSSASLLDDTPETLVYHVLSICAIEHKHKYIPAMAYQVSSPVKGPEGAGSRAGARDDSVLVDPLNGVSPIASVSQDVGCFSTTDHFSIGLQEIRI